MIVVVTFLLNAVLNFATGLAVAAVLGPTEFGRFAVASMAAIVLATTMFDWLRLSTVRHYNEESRIDRPQLRASLDRAYMIGAAVLILGTIVALAASLSGQTSAISSGLILATAATAFANAQFDFWSALARSRFLNRTYALLVISKNVLALAAMIAVGLAYHSAVATMAAFCGSVAVAIALVWARLRDAPSPPAQVDRALIATFLRYGMPVVAGNAIFQLIILINRWFVGTTLGYSDVGHLALATDICIRIFLSVGAGFDVLMFQKAVRLETTQGADAARSQIETNATLVLAILAPMAGGYYMVLPMFEALVVPTAYHGTFAAMSAILLPGVFAFGVMQFAFGPAFQMAGRTYPFTVAALAGLTCDLVLLAAFVGRDALHFAYVQSAALCAATAVAGVYALRANRRLISVRDVAAVAVGTIAMMVAVIPMRSFATPALGLISAVLVGAAVYGAVVVAFNIAGLRDKLNP
ncbi:MAG TPA: lipopolysaccharide biosynthesis protein [Beijerinckiaceae bacterium]|nr:lipopolysaccharide biosynthesis protein [Beijerinckiaceae bacterium]